MSKKLVSSTLTALACVNVLSTPLPEVSAEAEKPNIVFVLVDEMFKDSLPWYDKYVEAPNLEKLRSEGMEMTRVYSVNPQCSPARASIITGLYSTTHGLYWNDSYSLDPDTNSVAKELKKEGYETGYIGKWHMERGHVKNVPVENRQGFDWWAGFNAGHNYWNSTYYLNDDPNPRVDTGYEVDYQSDYAAEFIRENKDNKFALQISIGAPHTPHYPGGAYSDERFQNLDIEQTNVANRPNVPKEQYEKAKYQNAGYNVHVKLLDQAVGKIMDSIEESGIEDNTILIFTADHGEMMGAHGLYGKGCPFEESVSIPFLIKYPKAIPKNSKTDILMSQVDFAPTLLSFAGICPPLTMQGMDYSKSLTLNTPTPVTDVVYSQGQLTQPREYRQVITKDYTLVCRADAQDNYIMKPEYLFSYQDKYQMNNLLDKPEYADVQSRMYRLMTEKATEIGDNRFLDPKKYIVEAKKEMQDNVVPVYAKKPVFADDPENPVLNIDFEDFDENTGAGQLGFLRNTTDPKGVATVYQGDDNNKALLIQTGGTSDIRLTIPFENNQPLTGSYVLEYQTKFSSIVAGHTPAIMDTADNKTLCILGIGPTGNSTLNNQGNKRHVYDEETWNTVRTVIDFDAKLYYTTINGAELPRLGFMETVDKIDALRFMLQRGGSMFVDDIRLYKADQYTSWSHPNMLGNLYSKNPDSASQEILVTLDGKKLSFTQNPIIIEGRTMVPLRGIFEELGATVDWNGETQTVTAKKGETEIVLTIGDKAAYVNGRARVLDQPGVIVNSTTLVPVRFIAESFDAHVIWDDKANTVVIKTIPEASEPVFEFTSSTEGFVSLGILNAKDGILHFTSPSRDNKYIRNENVFIDPTKYKTLRMKLKQSKPGRVFFGFNKANGSEYDKRIEVARGTTAFQEYTYDLSSDPRWDSIENGGNGVIVKIRFDVQAQEGETAEIDYIIFE